uniref:Uncharacterized protein n=1 Tax=Oryza nivara TaxID=4536 RepID=A0A0E0G2R1_ORYNI
MAATVAQEHGIRRPPSHLQVREESILIPSSTPFSRLVMELRLPMQGGIEPLSPLELMFSAMTRIWVCVLLHETPCQLQKSRDSRAPLSVSVSSLIAIGREHEKTKTAKSGMSFGKEANKRIIFAVGPGSYWTFDEKICAFDETKDITCS